MSGIPCQGRNWNNESAVVAWTGGFRFERIRVPFGIEILRGGRIDLKFILTEPNDIAKRAISGLSSASLRLFEFQAA